MSGYRLSWKPQGRRLESQLKESCHPRSAPKQPDAALPGSCSERKECAFAWPSENHRYLGHCSTKRSLGKHAIEFRFQATHSAPFSSRTARCRLPSRGSLCCDAAAPEPVTPAERGRFLIEAADELGRHAVIGPGLVHRGAAELQRPTGKARAPHGRLTKGS